MTAFPNTVPHYLVRGKGCRVWDLDGNEFIDMGMGLTSAGLGHAYGPVVERVRQALELGVNYSLPHPMEVELAERIVGLYDGAEMVKLGEARFRCHHRGGEACPGLYRQG